MNPQPSRGVGNWLVHHGQLYLLALAALCLAIQAFFLVAVPPATGFETSIYEPYPFAFWFAFGLCLALIVAVLLASTVGSQSFYGRALTILAVNYGILLFLPVFRGYQLHDRGTGDLLVHLGHVRGIAETGTVTELWYPFEHVLMAVFVIFGVPLEMSSLLFSWIFLLLFILTSGLFMRSFTRRELALAVGTVAAVPVLMTSLIPGVLPSIFSVLLFPVLLIFLDRSRRNANNRYLALLCITAFAVVVFHPVTALFMVLLLITTAGFDYLFNRLSHHRVRIASGGIALSMIPVVFVWYTSFDKTWSMVNSIIGRLLGGTPSATARTAGDVAVLTPTQTAIRFIQLYGAIFIYLFVAAIVTIIILYRTYHGIREYVSLYLIIQFGIGFVLAVVLLMQPLEALEPIRNSRYMVLIAVFVVALAIISISSVNDSSQKIAIIALAILIVIAAVLAAGAVYKPNNHMTKSEYTGVDHTIEYHPSHVEVYSLNMRHKMEQYVRSTRSPEIRSPRFGASETELPSRLGYTESDTAAEIYGDAYVVTKEFDTEFHTASYFFPQQQEAQFVYDESDKERLRTDVTVDRVYDNGGFEGWRVTI